MLGSGIEEEKEVDPERIRAAAALRGVKGACGIGLCLYGLYGLYGLYETGRRGRWQQTGIIRRRTTRLEPWKRSPCGMTRSSSSNTRGSLDCAPHTRSGEL